MAVAHGAHRRRLDERVEPDWAMLSENLFRYGGIAVGLVILWLGFLTGGFFILLTGTLAAIAAVGGWLLADVVARESWYQRPHAKPITAIMLIALPVTFVAFAQVAGPLLTPPPVLSQVYGGQLSPAHEQVVIVSVDPRVEGMRMSVSIPSSDGAAVRWFVVDPTGQSRWSGRTDENGYVASKDLPVLPGQWTVHLIDDVGTAQFAVTWQGWTSAEASPAP